MNRRALLVVAPLAAAAMLLDGCASASQLEADAEGAADAVSAMAVALEGIVPASDAAALAEIEDLAAQASKDATALGGLAAGADPSSEIRGIVGAITAYDGFVVEFFPASAPIVTVLNAALTVGEALYADAGIKAPVGASRGRAGIRARGIAPMPISEARAFLRAKVHPRTRDHR